ncbi:hypothetical protein TDB9533_01119 [Thalassocella blandensis]|nr:hypothetical protein TDB9533_01119 [Thalassocella blandensis]
MKVFKIVLALVLVLVLLIGGAIYYVLTNLNALVKQIVESEGPKITHTTVQLNEVDLEPLKGRGELKGFKIGNPGGYTSEHLLKWDSILLHIDPQSLQTDVIVIEEFGVSGVNIKVEQKGKTTNVQDLLKALPSGSSSSSETSSGTSEAQVRMAIKRLKFADNSVDVITEKFGSANVEVPAFELSNIGDPNVGLTPEQLSAAILKPLMKKAKDAAEDKLKNMAREELEAKLDAKKEELKQKADEEKAKAESKLKAKEDEMKDKLNEEDKEKLNKLKGLL